MTTEECKDCSGFGFGIKQTGEFAFESEECVTCAGVGRVETESATDVHLWEHLSVGSGGWFEYDQSTGQYRYTTTETGRATDDN